jgi:hypothetical protein
VDKKTIRRFRHLVNRSGGPDACWPWTGAVNHGGYGVITLGSRTDGTRRTAITHRVAFFLKYGHWPTPCGCHSCDVRYPPGDLTYRRCCNPTHIWEGTSADNTADMVAKKRNAFGERASRVELTEIQVRALLILRGSVEQQRAAELVGTSRRNVDKIWNRRTWTHLHVDEHPSIEQVKKVLKWLKGACVD